MNESIKSLVESIKRISYNKSVLYRPPQSNEENQAENIHYRGNQINENYLPFYEHVSHDGYCEKFEQFHVPPVSYTLIIENGNYIY